MAESQQSALLDHAEPFELSDEQRAELRQAMADIDRGEYVDGDVFLDELGISG